jgi:diketogulonate reductase-like aldo/keto reductase
MSKQLITIGRATQEGTKFFKNRHNSIKFNKIPSLGLRVSPIGIGTFRLKEIPEHCQAISNALSNGLNLIDSSNHFQNGESEETVGKVLEAEFKNGLNRSVTYD